MAVSAAGGQILPNDPSWAPWPVHAWPGATKKSTIALANAAAQTQEQNNAAIVQLQAQMAAAGC